MCKFAEIIKEISAEGGDSADYITAIEKISVYLRSETTNRLKKMTKTIKITAAALALLGSFASPAMGKTISENRALEIARNFRQQSGALRGVASSEPLKVEFSFKSDDGAEALYVVAAKEGFVLVAADDLFYPVVGYSDTGSFDYLMLPENVRWWLNHYARQAQRFRENGYQAAQREGEATRFAEAAQFSEVAPIMKTRWDQDDPFNRMCPRIGNSRSATGCVATAVTQVMKVFNWPEKSTGTATFDGGIVSFDSTYEWDQMLDYYGYSSYTSRQANAVAQLMWDFGRSVDMEYGWESGALTYKIPSALYTNFGYDKSITYSLRSYYSDSAWDRILVGQLQQGCPIIYGGASRDGAHQFVLDGYRDGYYHVNWGWSGSYDGYFLLDLLDPEGVGIGGGGGSFDEEQDAVYNLKKDEGGIIQVQLSGTGSFRFYRTSNGVDNFTTAESEMSEYIGGTGFINFTGSSMPKAKVGVKLVDMKDPEKEYYCVDTSTYDYQPWTNIYKYIQVKIVDIPDGEYRVSGVVRYGGSEWTPVIVPDGCTDYVLLSIAKGKRTYNNNPPKDIEITSVTLDPTTLSLKEGETASIKATVTPSNATNPGLMWASSNPTVAEVKGGVVTAIKAGNCVISATTADGSQITETVSVTVEEDTGVETVTEDIILSDVYDTQGRKVMSGVTESEVYRLQKGIYIFAGKKIVVK